MNEFQEDVAEFNAAVGATRGNTPALRDTKLRARLILEEACETVVAMLGSSDASDLVDKAATQVYIDHCTRPSQPDLVEAIDGLTDLLFVTFGSFDAFGVDAVEPWALVHAANMTKANAPKDEHGKVTKPPNFVPPQERIRVALIAMGWKP